MRLLVCGGRDYDDLEEVWAKLNVMKPDLIITGGAPGADTLAQQWADMHGVPCMVFPAAWECFGHPAGPTRNGWMLKFGQPDWVLAFPGGRGTENMIRQAVIAGVPVTQVTV